jgi:hypothetical protein
VRLHLDTTPWPHACLDVPPLPDEQPVGRTRCSIDLADEVNGDRSTADAHDANACAASCAADNGCDAWTFTALSTGGKCRTKSHAQRSLLVVGGSPGCFLPSHGNWSNATSTSGFKSQANTRFVQLYVDRASSWRSPTSCGFRDCTYGHFGYAALLRLRRDDTALELHAFADRSIVEVFGQGGRAAVTARVYPTLASSSRIGVFGNRKTRVQTRAWALKPANVSKEEVLRHL